MNIGLLADGVEGEVYTVEDASRVIASVMELLETTDKQLSDLPRQETSLTKAPGYERYGSISPD